MLVLRSSPIEFASIPSFFGTGHQYVEIVLAAIEKTRVRTSVASIPINSLNLFVHQLHFCIGRLSKVFAHYMPIPLSQSVCLPPSFNPSRMLSIDGGARYGGALAVEHRPAWFSGPGVPCRPIHRVFTGTIRVTESPIPNAGSICLHYIMGLVPWNQAREVVTVASSLRQRGIVGVDLSGDPTCGCAADFVPILHHARSLGLKVRSYPAEEVLSLFH